MYREIFSYDLIVYLQFHPLNFEEFLVKAFSKFESGFHEAVFAASANFIAFFWPFHSSYPSPPR